MKRWTLILAIVLMTVMLPAMVMAGGDRDNRRPREHRWPNAKSIFERIDADGDGQITREGLKKTLKSR